MPTPLFNMRLPTADRRNLERVAKLVGAKSASGFASYALGAICSGDEERVRGFLENLMRGISGQMALKLTQAHTWEARKQAKVSKSRAKRGAGR